MAEKTRTDSQAQADSQAEILAEVWQAIDAGQDYEGVEAQQYLDEMALEVVWEKGEPFAVVLGIGGPHVEITGGGRASGSGFQLDVYWAGETAVKRSEAITRTGEYFRADVEESE
jgi:hypothetical protein